jgi:hypothetical protein
VLRRAGELVTLDDDASCGAARVVVTEGMRVASTSLGGWPAHACMVAWFIGELVDEHRSARIATPAALKPRSRTSRRPGMTFVCVHTWVPDAWRRRITASRDW